MKQNTKCNNRLITPQTVNDDYIYQGGGMIFKKMSQNRVFVIECSITSEPNE